MTAAPSIIFDGRADIGSIQLFAPIQLNLQSGLWTCLLGGSGVGKSTILRLVAGLDTGAEFAGSVTASDTQPVAQRVAYMAQDDLLLPWAKVTENIALGPRLRGQPVDPNRLDALLDRVGLADHRSKKPAQLSGGQRQRVALARTLLEDKPIILLDEPFSALDAKTRTEMQNLAVELLAGRTVLMVTHDPAEAARLGHSIAILSQKGLTQFPPPATNVPRPADAAETLDLQARLFRHLTGVAA
ncbi:MAG: ABC transporter ATP-binding protein [Pseudomonadota bacterium]